MIDGNQFVMGWLVKFLDDQPSPVERLVLWNLCRNLNDQFGRQLGEDIQGDLYLLYSAAKDYGFHSTTIEEDMKKNLQSGMETIRRSVSPDKFKEGKRRLYRGRERESNKKNYDLKKKIKIINALSFLSRIAENSRA